MTEHPSTDEPYMVEPDEWPKAFIFPADVDGDSWPMPDDFWQRVRTGLASVGLDYESC